MKLTKTIAAGLTVTALAASTTIPAFAASVTMYGYRNGTYQTSSHTSAFVESIEQNADLTYTIVFQPAVVYSQSGYIESIEINDKEYTADEEGYIEATFSYSPETLYNADGSVAVVGEPIEYSIYMESSQAHSSTSGALVIE